MAGGLAKKLARLRGMGAVAEPGQPAAAALQHDPEQEPDLGEDPGTPQARIAKLRQRLAELEARERGRSRQRSKEKQRPLHARHGGEGGDPEAQTGPQPWIPASAGMTLPRSHGEPGGVASSAALRVLEGVEAYSHAQGTICRRRAHLPVGTVFGHVELASPQQLCPKTLSRVALDAALAGVDQQRLLVFDTETTGLAGGTGTLPFLIGLAWFDQGGWHTEQLLLRGPGEEGPMLQHLAERLRWASALVSFNGKSFDWPLLRTRFVLNRVPVPEPSYHLDLLHSARRLFGPALNQVRLADLETQVLGYERMDDVPGYDIPELYFRYLRGADARCLEPVLVHNHDDLLASIALLQALHGHYQGYGLAPWRRHEDSHQGAMKPPFTPLAVAQVATRARHWHHAEATLQAWLQPPSRLASSGSGGALKMATGTRGDTAAAQGAGWQLLGWHLRRRSAFADAVQAYQQGLRVYGNGSRHALGQADCHLALAKLYEHQLKNIAAAQEHAAQTMPAEDKAAQSRRLERLRQRASRARLKADRPSS